MADRAPADTARSDRSADGPPASPDDANPQDPRMPHERVDEPDAIFAPWMDAAMERPLSKAKGFDLVHSFVRVTRQARLLVI